MPPGPPHPLARTAAAAGAVLLLLASVAHAFNLDTTLYTKYRGDPGSMFGFSVALHREAGASWVLVGAPKAETRQPGVTRAGAVYACDISKDDHCSQIPFDLSGHNNSTSGEQMDEKNSQWFGASVYSAGEDKPVVACAPMYIFYSTVQNPRRDPVGTCFLARNSFREFSEYSPCRTRDWGYHRQGSCQAGLAASISRDGERLFIGAVGSRYWQGELYSINDRARLLYIPPQYTIQIEGMVISQNTHRRPDVLSTPEGPFTEDDTYMGYSITVGDFGGTVLGHEDVAVGRPRGAGLRGQVLLYTWNLTNIHNITGEQLGSYFGYSMCTSDVDGDGRDDLIIGAPLYTDLGNNAGSYETGRVYVMYQGRGPIRFNQLHVKDGKNSKARFGLALASLGDINKDGFGDFAVGAPYDGPDERGAVYLYHGGAEGVRESFSQVVWAEDIVGSPSTFGFSLSGGRDLDENDYPDLVVGAYDSSSAVFLRARPVVKVSASINFLSEGKQIALEEKNCTLRDRTRVPCVQVNSCLKYDGIGVDKRLDFEVQFVLDSKKQRSPRLFFLSDEGRHMMNQSLRLIKDQETCKRMFVYLKPNVRDKLTSLEAEIRYSLLGNYSRRASRQLSPVLDLNEELSRRDAITIRKNCGRDNICIPDLRLIAQPSVKRYLLGSGERFHLNILVENEGEDAFEAAFDTTIPAGMNYVKIERVDEGEKEIPVQCSPPSFVNNNTLHCDIGNPLPREKLVQFKVILQPFHQDGMKPRYEFEMRVNSTNPENGTTISDNLKHITVPIWVETDLILQGSSHPADVHYNISLYDKTDNFTTESEVGPQVIHVYGIRNKGPSDILQAEAYFLWPSYTLAGDHLLYLLEQPETVGNIRCEYVEEANVEQLVLDRKRKSYFDHHGELGVQAGLTGSKESSSSSQSSFSEKSSTSGKTVVEETHRSSSSSKSQSSSSSSSLGGKVLTAEERRRRLEEEEARRGESEKRGHRTQSGGVKEVHYSSNGGRLESDSHSKPVYVNERGRVEVSRTPVVAGKSYESSHQESRTSGGNRHHSEGGLNSGNRDLHTHFQEKEFSSNTTWKTGETPKTVTSTKWKTIDDGIEKSGSSSSSTSNIDLANLGLSSSGNKRYTISGVGGGAGKMFTEERHYEKNTTWDSREGKPKVTEFSTWKTNEDGVIKSGSNVRGSIDERTTVGMSGRGEVRQGSNVGSRVSSDHFEHNSGSSVASAGAVGVGKGRERGSWASQGGSEESEEEAKRRLSASGNAESTYSEKKYNSRVFEKGGREHSAGAGSTHRTFSGEDSGYIDKTEGTYSRNHQSVGSREESKFEGGAHRGTSGDRTYTSGSAGRRNEGRHKVHWSSEQSGSIDEDGSYRGTANVDEDIRKIVGTNRDVTQGSGGRGGKTYTEEHSREWNTTWSSADGGKPKTTEFTRWTVNEDGLLKNGSHRDTYDGLARIDQNLNKHLVVTGAESGGINLDQNLVRTGKTGTVYSEEKETSYNTTWDSASGGRPITRQQTNWKVNKDGVVTSGSKSDVFEGTPPLLHEKDLRKFENSQSRSATESRVSEGHFSAGSRSSQEQGTYSKAEEGLGGSRRHGGSSIHGSEHHRHQAGSTNVGDLLRGSQGVSSSQDASFSHFGEVAQGPRDGVAKTYTLDLGVNSGNAEGSGSSARHQGHSRHYSTSGESLRGSQSAASLGTSSSQDASFSHFSEIGQGSQDGVAKTHTLDLGVNSGNTEGSESSTRHQGHSRHYSSSGESLRGSQSVTSLGTSSSQDASFSHFGEVAQGPRDGVAKTYTLDLGVNSGNAEGSGSSTRHQGHSRHYSSSGESGSTGVHYSSAGERSSSGRSEEASRGYSYRNDDRIEGYRSGGGGSHSSWSSHSTSGTVDSDIPQDDETRQSPGSSSYRHVSDESNRGKFHLYPRYRRQAADEDLAKSLDCGPTDCSRIKCTLGPLKKDEEAWIAFRARVWVPTIKKLSTNVEVGLSSLVVARVSQLPHIGSPDVVNIHTHEVHSQVMPPELPVKPDIVPLWIVVLSACAGAIILMLLVYLLYKCGFFKRQRPSSAPEKQPLNRNGYQHGDEAL